MPSFQPAQMPFRYGEYASGYGNPNSGAFQEYQGSFVPYPNGGSQDLQFPAAQYELYKHSVASSASMYPLPNGYANGRINMPPIGAPVLPPLRNDDRFLRTSQEHAQQRRQHSDAMHKDYHQPKEEKAVGGVSAKLDYDMEQMTDFVAEMSVGMYGIYKSRICIADIDLIRSIKPGVPYPSTFRKWLVGVLNATRLPSATILLSLSYLTLRVRGLSETTRFVQNERSLNQMLTVALILGSKFLDDNTFQNKSWAEVSQIPVVELNKDERDWLSAFNHRLHYDSDSPDGFTSWEKQWKDFKARASYFPTTKHSIDTGLPRQRSVRQTISPSSFQHQFPMPSVINMPCQTDDTQYNTPSYSPYNPWYNHSVGGGIDSSPPTAPHSGPNTPDYYAGHGGWGPIDPYSSSRQQQYALASMSQFSQQMPAYSVPYQTPNFSHGMNGVWNCHSSACQCGSCRAQAQFLQPRYGPIVVG